MKKELEDLGNYFNGAVYLLYVIGRGAEEQSGAISIEDAKSYHREMSFALEYMASTLHQKVEDFWSIIEEMPEDEAVCDVAISEEEKKVLEIYRNLDNVETLESLLRGFRNGYNYK